MRLEFTRSSEKMQTTLGKTFLLILSLPEGQTDPTGHFISSVCGSKISTPKSEKRQLEDLKLFCNPAQPFGRRDV